MLTKIDVENLNTLIDVCEHKKLSFDFWRLKDMSFGVSFGPGINGELYTMTGRHSTVSGAIDEVLALLNGAGS